MDEQYVDGNGLGSPSWGMFAADSASGMGQCVSVEFAKPVAVLQARSREPRLRADCRGLRELILRLVRGPAAARRDLRRVRCQVPRHYGYSLADWH